MTSRLLPLHGELSLQHGLVRNERVRPTGEGGEGGGGEEGGGEEAEGGEGLVFVKEERR